jgi:hypothetical protein
MDAGQTKTGREHDMKTEKSYCGWTLAGWDALTPEERAEELRKESVAALNPPRKTTRRRTHGIDGIRLGDGSEDDCIG